MRLVTVAIMTMRWLVVRLVAIAGLMAVRRLMRLVGSMLIVAVRRLVWLVRLVGSMLIVAVRRLVWLVRLVGLVTMGWLVVGLVASVVAIACLVSIRGLMRLMRSMMAVRRLMRLVRCGMAGVAVASMRLMTMRSVVSIGLLLVAMVSTVTVAMAVIFLIITVSVALFNGSSGAHVAVGNVSDSVAPATVLVTALVLVKDCEIAFLVLRLGMAVPVAVTVTVILLLVVVTMAVAALLNGTSGAHLAVGNVSDSVAPATVSVVSIVFIEDGAIRFSLALSGMAEGEVLIEAVGLVGLVLVIGGMAVRSVTMGVVRGVAVGVGRGVLAVTQGARGLNSFAAAQFDGAAELRGHGSASKIKGSGSVIHARAVRGNGKHSILGKFCGSWCAVDSTPRAVSERRGYRLLGELEGGLYLGLLVAGVRVGRCRGGVAGGSVTVRMAGVTMLSAAMNRGAVAMLGGVAVLSATQNRGGVAMRGSSVSM